MLDVQRWMFDVLQFSRFRVVLSLFRHFVFNVFQTRSHQALEVVDHFVAGKGIGVIFELDAIFVEERERPMDIANLQFNVHAFGRETTDVPFLHRSSPFDDVDTCSRTGCIKRELRKTALVLGVEPGVKFHPFRFLREVRFVSKHRIDVETKRTDSPRRVEVSNILPVFAGEQIDFILIAKRNERPIRSRIVVGSTKTQDTAFVLKINGIR